MGASLRARITSPLLGEKTRSKSRYTAATVQEAIRSSHDPDGVTTAAMIMAEAEEATVPERYIAETRDLGTPAMEDLSVNRVTIGTRRARFLNRGGRALARVVRPSLMLLNLMPATLPTK